MDSVAFSPLWESDPSPSFDQLAFDLGIEPPCFYPGDVGCEELTLQLYWPDVLQ